MDASTGTLAHRWRWPIRLGMILAGLTLAAVIALVVVLRGWPAVLIERSPSGSTVVWCVGMAAEANVPIAASAAKKRLTGLGVDEGRVILVALGAGRTMQRGAWRIIANKDGTWRTPEVRATLVGHLLLADTADRREARAAYRFGSADGIGLGWLRSQDMADGGWPAARSEIMPGYVPDAIGVTALATLAMLNAGYDHRMPSQFKKRLIRVVHRLLAAQGADGSFAADPRDHALAACAIAESYGLSNDPALKKPATRALIVLLTRAQGENVTADPAEVLLATLAAKSGQGAGIAQGHEALMALREAALHTWPSIGVLAKRWRERPGCASATELDAAGVFGSVLALTGEPLGSPRLADAAAVLAPPRDLVGWLPIGLWSGFLFRNPSDSAVWRELQDPIRQAIEDAQELGEASRDGRWQGKTADLGDQVAATALHVWTLGIWYRYQPQSVSP